MDVPLLETQKISFLWCGVGIAYIYFLLYLVHIVNYWESKWIKTIIVPTVKGEKTMNKCFAGGHLRYVDGAWRDDNGVKRNGTATQKIK